jgi:hypothetical protein
MSSRSHFIVYCMILSRLPKYTHVLILLFTYLYYNFIANNEQLYNYVSLKLLIFQNYIHVIAVQVLQD